MTCTMTLLTGLLVGILMWVNETLPGWRTLSQSVVLIVHRERPILAFGLIVLIVVMETILILTAAYLIADSLMTALR